nr:uncharacterized protein K02A2.6-like isoform X2 [Dermacentor andersoni]
MRNKTLERIRQGHLGINKCKSQARHLVFWPGINCNIETFAQACSACKTYAYRQPQEPLKLRPVPDKPWHRVGIVIFEHGGRSYLCVYDALSNFPEVRLLKDTTAKTVIEATSAIFARYGIPVEGCSDNGPQFSSHALAAFARRYDFNHTTSSPRYPQSNGLAEKDLLQWNPDHHLAKYFKEDDYGQCCPTSGPAQAAAYRSIVRPTVAADDYHHSTPEIRYASKKGSGPPKVKSFKLRHIPGRIT